MEGKDYNPKKSLQYLNEHFDMLRTNHADDAMKKDQKKIDAARVNIGIVEANQKMEAYKFMVL
jgi:hypothetical protein